MKSYQTKVPIRQWAADDRPIEKLINKGEKYLSDTELLAILIGSGSQHENVMDLSKRMLNSFNNNLNSLGKLNIHDLKRFKGIGNVKATVISAAMELGRRRQLSDLIELPKIYSSGSVYKIMAPILKDLPHEEFWILLLNRANRVLKKTQISQGGVAGTIVDAKIIFKLALEQLACSIILCHNHPSGNLNPSQADINITKKLDQAAGVLDIEILDHVIIAGNQFYSFRDEGKL